MRAYVRRSHKSQGDTKLNKKMLEVASSSVLSWYEKMGAVTKGRIKSRGTEKKIMLGYVIYANLDCCLMQSVILIWFSYTTNFLKLHKTRKIN